MSCTVVVVGGPSPTDVVFRLTRLRVSQQRFSESPLPALLLRRISACPRCSIAPAEFIPGPYSSPAPIPLRPRQVPWEVAGDGAAFNRRADASGEFELEASRFVFHLESDARIE